MGKELQIPHLGVGTLPLFLYMGGDIAKAAGILAERAC
jgi:hypothetical protein